MINFLLIFTLATGLFSQNANNNELRKIYSKNGNNIEEIYDKLLLWSDDTKDHKKGTPMLRQRIYYIGNTNTKQKEENYRRLDGTLKEIIFFKDAEPCVREDYYATDFGLKDGKRGLLKSRLFYYMDCMCQESYNGSKTVQQRDVYGTSCITVQNQVSNSPKYVCPSVQGCTFIAN